MPYINQPGKSFHNIHQMVNPLNPLGLILANWQWTVEFSHHLSGKCFLLNVVILNRILTFKGVHPRKNDIWVIYRVCEVHLPHKNITNWGHCKPLKVIFKKPPEKGHEPWQTPIYDLKIHNAHICSAFFWDDSEIKTTSKKIGDWEYTNVYIYI